MKRRRAETQTQRTRRKQIKEVASDEEKRRRDMEGAEEFFSGPILCYILDGVLVVYCIIATALFFKEKFSFIPPVGEVVENPEENGRIYQELDRPREADPYQVLEPTRRKKKAAKKKKSKPTSDEQRDPDASETLALRDLAPPLPPQ